MPAPHVHLESSDAAELTEMLTFIDQWLTGPDHAQLTASLTRFVGADGYNLTQLRTDLARFTFLLGHDDGEQLFGTHHSPQPRKPDRRIDPAIPTPSLASLSVKPSSQSAPARGWGQLPPSRRGHAGLTSPCIAHWVVVDMILGRCRSVFCQDVYRGPPASKVPVALGVFGGLASIRNGPDRSSGCGMCTFGRSMTFLLVVGCHIGPP